MSPPHSILSIGTEQGGQDQRAQQGHWKAVPASSGLLAHGISAATDAVTGRPGRAAELFWCFVETDVFHKHLAFTHSRNY